MHNNHNKNHKRKTLHLKEKVVFINKALEGKPKKEEPRITCHYMVYSWMVYDLGLSGDDLVVYAIIHNFTRDGVSYYTGGRKLLTAMTRKSKTYIGKIIKKLVTKKYIIAKQMGNYTNYQADLKLVQKFKDNEVKK